MTRPQYGPKKGTHHSRRVHGNLTPELSFSPLLLSPLPISVFEMLAPFFPRICGDFPTAAVRMLPSSYSRLTRRDQRIRTPSFSSFRRFITGGFAWGQSWKLSSSLLSGSAQTACPRLAFRVSPVNDHYLTPIVTGGSFLNPPPYFLFVERSVPYLLPPSYKFLDGSMSPPPFCFWSSMTHIPCPFLIFPLPGSPSCGSPLSDTSLPDGSPARFERVSRSRSIVL